MSKHKYQQISQFILEEIKSCNYIKGHKLLGERELVQKYNCSRQTVRSAISLLCQEGILKSVQGSGTFVNKTNIHKKSGVVGVIATHISLPHFIQVLQNIEETLRNEKMYAMVACSENKFETERAILEDWLEKDIDGLIVEGLRATMPNPNIQLYKQFIEKGLPIIFINCYYKELEGLPYITLNNKQGGNMLGQYLLSKGHRHIAGIFKADDQESVDRFSAMAKYLNVNGCNINDDNVLWYTVSSSIRFFENFVCDIIAGCTAVVCFNDEIAYKLYKVLSSKGIEVEKAIEIVAFDKTFFSDMLPYKITTLQYPQKQMGKKVARKIINMINNITEEPELLSWNLVE